MRDGRGGAVRILALVWALALSLALLRGGGMAEGTEAPGKLEIEFSVSPAELVAPGDATMTFVITNHTGGEIRNICLTSADGLLSEPVGQLAAGESQTFARPHAVTQEELDAGRVEYVITCDIAEGEGGRLTCPLTAPVTRGSPRPEVDFTRQVSSEYVAAGRQVTITYRVTNNGNVPVSEIYVRDALGDFTGRLETLEVGATRTFISRVAISQETESSASLEYTVPGGETYTRRLDPVPIRLSDSALDAAFSVGRSVFDPNRADAVLVLTNEGNVDYADIAVMDDVYGGVIADSISLPRGSNPVEIAQTYLVRGDGEYRWRVTGVSQAGEALDFVTATMTLPELAQPGEVDIRLSVVPRTPRINRAGRVTFDVEIANQGGSMARDLLLYEPDRGDIRRLVVLPSGDPCRFSFTYDVRQDEAYVFCLNYLDADGRARTVSSDPIAVEIVPGGAVPEPAEGELPRLEGGSVKIGNSATFTILLAVASAALVSMFTILLVTSLRARRERRRRLAAQRRRIKEELGKTNRFTPLKDREKKSRREKKKT